MFSQKEDMFSTDLYMFSQDLDINVKWGGGNGENDASFYQFPDGQWRHHGSGCGIGT
jgi:hypothetical protein